MQRTIYITLILLFGWKQTQAQDTLNLSFEDAIRIGLSQNRNYNILKNEQQVLDMQKKSAQLSHLPRVNLNNDLFRQVGQQFQQVEGELIVTNVTNDLLSTGLRANMPVVNGRRRINMTQASSAFAEAGELAIERGAQDVVFTIAQRYLQVLLDRELFRIAQENLANQQEQLRQIEGFVEAGMRTLSDKYNQQSEVARLQTVALNARITMETDLWQLAETLQMDATMLPNPLPVALGAVEQNYLELPFNELYSMALLERKDLQRQLLLEKGNSKMVAVSKAAYYPQLNAFFNYNTFYTSLDNRDLQTQFFQVYPQRTIGLSLTIPIFNNFENRLEVTRSKIAAQNQVLEMQALKQTIGQETKLAYENFKAAIQREEATKVQLSAAEEAQQVIAERFRLGVSNFVDLAQANQQLVTAQSDYAQVQYTLFFQEMILKYALGVLEVDYE